ncbi:MAG: SRPBCC domain-containing protein [Proteobacteria bacterium]|nr:SRPBCC domain-containing protein [Pseudomonadota bacterium]
MADILHRLRIQAPSELVFAAISTAEGIRQWWTRDAEMDGRIGGVGAFGFYNRRLQPKVRITAMTPPARLEWEVVNGAWPGKTVVFDLKPDAAGTILFFAHRDFPEADGAYASANTRWGFYLVSLKNYLETGKGAPNPDDLNL